MALNVWSETYTQWLYNYCNSIIHNDYGTAGLLGNIYAESNICPFRQQGDFSPGYVNSQTLTTDFRAHGKDYFVYYDGNTGYSLAQWTSYGRRINYWDFVGQANIGDGGKSAEFLMYELQNSYQSVFNTLKNATSIKQASDKVLVSYESPADQSEHAKQVRASYGTEVYNTYSGGGPIPPGPGPGPGPQPPTPGPGINIRKLPIFMMLKKKGGK